MNLAVGLARILPLSVGATPQGGACPCLPALECMPAGPVVCDPLGFPQVCFVPALQQQLVSHRLLIMQSD